MSRKFLQPDEVLFREGDIGHTAYLIESGRVRISLGEGAGQVAVAELGAGDLLGEMAMIDAAPRTATATALEATQLLVINREHLAERIAQADPVVRALLGGQLKRYRSMLATLRGGDEPVSGAGMEEAMAIGKIRLESQLRDALTEKRLEMYLQPLYDIGESRIAGYEALVRWNHPERGVISPAEFIALAEETSLIVPVGEYILRESIAALAKLYERSGSLPFMSINVSPRQLAGGDLIQIVLELLKQACLPTTAIKLEITESQMFDYTQVAGLIEECRAAGVKLALDDFGTGFSNLSHLSALNFDTVKIDQGFVRGIDEPGKARAMLESIVLMVRAIGADALVEGVETPQQLATLKQLGVRYAQGYLINKPQPAADVMKTHVATPFWP